MIGLSVALFLESFLVPGKKAESTDAVAAGAPVREASIPATHDSETG
jgi:hypothetical protein